MAVTRARLNSYRADVDACGEAAAAYVEQYLAAIMAEYPGISVAELREVAIEAIEDSLNAFGDQAAELALELFDEIAGTEHDAQIYDVIDPERIDGKVRYYARSLVEGDVASFNRDVSDLTRYYVKRSAFENMAENCGRGKVRYARVPSGSETCPFCFMLASRGFVYHTAESAGEGHPYHVNCVLPETNLGAVGVRACLRRKYEGVVCHITTRGGRHLSVTPNHPVLTVRGWVDAGHLKDGDALLCASGGEGHEMSVPDVDEAPSSAEEVFEALRLLLASVGHSVPASAVDFDGEPVSDGDVEVIDVHGLLEGHIVSVGQEGVGYEPLARARGLQGREGFPSASPFDHGADRNVASTDGGVCGGCLCSPLLGGHLGRPDLSGFGQTSYLDPGLSEPSGHDVPADAIDMGELQHAISVLVSLNDVGGCWEAVAPRLDSLASQDLEDGASAYAELFGDVAGSHPRGIEIDYVSVVRHSDFVGHVYNLSTNGGWYLANDIITHNCDCVIVPGVKGLDPDSQVEGYRPTELYRRWKGCAGTVGEDPDTRDAAALGRIRAEVATRDWRWLYEGRVPEITFETDALRQEIERDRPHEIETAKRLREFGIAPDFVVDSIEYVDEETGLVQFVGLADFASGYEIKSLESASSYNTINGYLKNTSHKENAKYVCFDNSSGAIDDATLVEYIQRSRSFRRGRVYIIDSSGRYRFIR